MPKSRNEKYHSYKTKIENDFINNYKINKSCLKLSNNIISQKEFYIDAKSSLDQDSYEFSLGPSSTGWYTFPENDQIIIEGSFSVIAESVTADNIPIVDTFEFSEKALNLASPLQISPIIKGAFLYNINVLTKKLK
jgi:hypothetical protein